MRKIPGVLSLYGPFRPVSIEGIDAFGRILQKRQAKAYHSQRRYQHRKKHYISKGHNQISIYRHKDRDSGVVIQIVVTIPFREQGHRVLLPADLFFARREREHPDLLPEPRGYEARRAEAPSGACWEGGAMRCDERRRTGGWIGAKRRRPSDRPSETGTEGEARCR